MSRTSKVQAARVELGDYTTADSRMVLMSGVAVILGGAGAVLSWVLLRLIFLATNIFYFHRSRCLRMRLERTLPTGCRR